MQIFAIFYVLLTHMYGGSCEWSFTSNSRLQNNVIIIFYSFLSWKCTYLKFNVYLLTLFSTVHEPYADIDLCVWSSYLIPE